jgi:drug/metabolite transporter (DMT)-like permease
MTRFAQGNLYLVVSVFCAAASQVVLKAVLRELPLEPDLRSWAALLAPARLLRSALAVVLLSGGFASWVWALRCLPLSYAYPIACASILLVVLFSALFLGEAVTPRMWLGTLLVLAGVALLVPRG